MESFNYLNTDSMTLDGSKAREMEKSALEENPGDIADAFQAITSMVVE